MTPDLQAHSPGVSARSKPRLQISDSLLVPGLPGQNLSNLASPVQALVNHKVHISSLCKKALLD